MARALSHGMVLVFSATLVVAVCLDFGSHLIMLSFLLQSGMLLAAVTNLHAEMPQAKRGLGRPVGSPYSANRFFKN